MVLLQEVIQFIETGWNNELNLSIVGNKLAQNLVA